MRDTFFWIDGKRCDEVGIHLQEPVAFSSAKPKRKTISVPGRNGDLHIYEGAFENITGVAKCFALESARVNEALNAIAAWSLLSPGYHRLEVTDEPESYRMAFITSGPETEIRAHALAPFSLSFDCKPQKFLKSGEHAVQIAKSGTKLFNSAFPSFPQITVYGSGDGVLSIAGKAIVFKSNFYGPLTFDCDTQNAYNGPDNKNNEISAPDMISLPHGDCSISWAGGIEKVEIIPRWWTL